MSKPVAPEGEHEHAFDWFKLLDILVWCAVALIAAVALEWMIGYVVREKLARGADRYLAKVNAGKAEPAE